MKLHKRLVDLAIGVPALCASAPLIASLGALVKVTSPGPAFFVHERVGREGKPIRVFKLRTMVNDADKHGAAVTGAGDARVTAVGRLLRRAKLDELPQLWNVVRGDMSLVGPRPEAQRYVDKYRAEWKDVFAVRPGITDPASLAFRDEESLLEGVEDTENAYIEGILPHKIPLALEGVRHSGVAYDLGILARTAVALAARRREEHPAVVASRRAINSMRASL